MKLIFEKTELVRAVNTVQKAVSVRTTMEILQCILIDAKGSSIFFAGNDLDLGIQTGVTGEIVEKGAVALNAKTFSELVKKLPEDQITFEVNENNLCHLTCDKKSFEIPGLSADEFSYLPEIEKENSVTLSQNALKDIINQTIFSLSVNDVNVMMTGELFEIKEGNLKVVALDSHRISIRNIPVDEKDRNIKVVIPGKSLKEISGILESDTEKEVHIYFSERHVLFEFDDTRVVSRLLEGNYFNVNQMISNDNATQIVLNRKQLIDSIDILMVLIQESDKRPVIMDIKDDVMDIYVKTGKGYGIESVDIKKTGADIKIGFNPKFIIEALKVIEDEEVTISFVNPKSPCFIKDDEDTYLYLILPVNFTED